MGITTSGIPQPPLPDLTIHLSTPPDTLFRPYSIVTGHVTLVPVVPIAPRAIQISLFGQALVWYRTSRHYPVFAGFRTEYHHWRDNAPLLEDARNMLQAFNSEPPTLEVGHTYTYPFYFRSPAGTPNSREGQYKEDADERWVVEPHDLPPSLLHRSRLTMGEQPNHAKVEYAVCVRLVCPGVGIVQGNNLQDMLVTTPVSFLPAPSTTDIPEELLSYSKTFALQTSALAGYDVDSIGFRQGLRDRFSSHTPKLEIETSIEIPDRMTAGSEFRFRASCRVSSKSDNVFHSPAVTLRVLRLDLKDITYIRAPRDWEASIFLDGRHYRDKYNSMPPPDAPYSGKEYKDRCKRRTHLNSLPDSVTLELEEVPGYEERVPEQSSCYA
jgi:hypothetical protein